MKYGLVEDGVLVRVIENDPANLFDALEAESWMAVPDGVRVGDVFDGKNFAAPPDKSTLPPTSQERAAFAALVDAQVDAIYISVQGERVTEYMLAESDATAYKSAGYSGTVPSSVASWAAAKAKDAKWAADDILATATAWRGAQGAIRAQRLAIKEAAKTATLLAPLRAQWAGFLAVVKKQLGVV